MTKMTFAIAVAVLCASMASAGGETLQQIDRGNQVFPERIGRLAPDGTVAEWAEDGLRGDCDWLLVFDCFWPDEIGDPCCAEECGQQNPSFRWYFGPTYCNGYVTNDMEFDATYGGWNAERLLLAWLWSPPVGENMAIVVEFYDGFDATCGCGDECLGEWRGGVVLDFGYTDPGSGYYHTDIDLCGTDWLTTPLDGAGAYNIWFATYDDANPDDLYMATCAQPMLWGTSEDRPGDQGPIQWDDDFPMDWQHQVPDECYDYSFGICPDPLGAMFAFYVDANDAPPCGGADLDGDGVVGHSDLSILLSDWGCTGYCAADINHDGQTGQSDLGILLANWDCEG